MRYETCLTISHNIQSNTDLAVTVIYNDILDHNIHIMYDSYSS